MEGWGGGEGSPTSWTSRSTSPDAKPGWVEGKIQRGCLAGGGGGDHGDEARGGGVGRLALVRWIWRRNRRRWRRQSNSGGDEGRGGGGDETSDKEVACVSSPTRHVNEQRSMRFHPFFFLSIVTAKKSTWTQRGSAPCATLIAFNWHCVTLVHL